MRTHFGLLMLLAATGLTGCNKAQFSLDKKVEKTSCQRNPENCTEKKVVDLCLDARQKGRLATVTKQIEFKGNREIESFRDATYTSYDGSITATRREAVFAEPIPVICPWKEGSADDNTPDASGNFTRKNEFLRTRIEKYDQISLPDSNGVLCEIDISGDNQAFSHDDVFYITFDNYVLATSLKRSLKNEPTILTNNGISLALHQYDWLSFANTQFGGNGGDGGPLGIALVPDNYCLGEDVGVGNCEIPVTDTAAPLRMSFGPEAVAVAAVDVRGAHQVGLIVTGDDNDRDCFHTDLKVDVTLRYALPE